MFYVYILELKNGQLYTGFTADLKERMLAHRYGKVASTSRRRPVQLIHYEAYLLESDARRREKFLKSSDGKSLLKKQIRDLLTDLEIRRGARVVDRDGLAPAIKAGRPDDYQGENHLS